MTVSSTPPTNRAKKAGAARRGRPSPPTDATLAQALAWHRGGRQPTGAHPLCVCRKPIEWPPRPEIDWEAYQALETPEERREYWREDAYGGQVRAWREECERVRLAARCAVHGVTPSRWCKPW